MSSSAPAIVEFDSGDFKIMALGGSGGTRILTGIAQVFLEVGQRSERLDNAVNQPRFHHQLYPNTVFLFYHI